MLESIRRYAAIPQAWVQAVPVVGVLASFFWLLLNDRIHPVVIYLLQLYLSF